MLLNVLEVMLGVGERGSASGGSGLLTVPSSTVLTDELGVELERDVGVLFFFFVLGGGRGEKVRERKNNNDNKIRRGGKKKKKLTVKG